MKKLRSKPNVDAEATDPMDLQEFVSQALTQIIKGIAKAQKDCKNIARINPRLRHTLITHETEKHPTWRADPEHVRGTGIFLDEHGQNSVSLVEFDVAITVNEGSKTAREGTGANIAVVGFKVGLAGHVGTEKNESQTNVSRVAFKVPVRFPVQR